MHSRLGEFELIQQFFHRQMCRSDILTGIGDDAAVVVPTAGETLLVCTDTMVSGRHFFAEADPQSVGWKLLAVNLSDMAAMGGIPQWATLALTLPEADTAWLGGFANGFFALAERFGVALVGGDTTCGPLTLSLTLLGKAPPEQVIRRSGAHPGDGIYVSGYPGEAACALDCLCKQRQPEAEHRRRLEYPEPRVALGVELRRCATAAIDVSDGLLQDLQHLLQASGVGAVIDRQALPLRKNVNPDRRPQLQQILGGGDDYELLFTLPASEEVQGSVDCPVHCIGRIEARQGMRWLDTGALIDERLLQGFRHF